MNEQLQAALATILDKTINGIDASVDFMQAELPDVIEQLLMWYGVKGFILCVIGLILLIKPFIIWFKWVKHCNVDDGYHDGLDKFMAPSIPVLISFSVSLFFINLEWLQIWIAPKIWLIEYAAQLAK